VPPSRRYNRIITNGDLVAAPGAKAAAKPQRAAAAAAPVSIVVEDAAGRVAPADAVGDASVLAELAAGYPADGPPRVALTYHNHRVNMAT
jgi:hypothetical protein